MSRLKAHLEDEQMNVNLAIFYCVVKLLQVLCPKLGICPLHFTHPGARTHNKHTPGAVGCRFCCGVQGAIGGLGVLLRGTLVVGNKSGRKLIPARAETRTRSLRVTSPTL